MAIPLPDGKAFDVNSINEQYARLAGDRGLTKTLRHYQQAKNPGTGDYNFGKITELYFDLQGPDKAHWRQSVATFAEIHPLLKSVIVTALTHRPDPLEIQWNWDAYARPMGPDVSKGVSIVYDSASVPPKYYILIFGYTMPA